VIKFKDRRYLDRGGTIKRSQYIALFMLSIQAIALKGPLVNRLVKNIVVILGNLPLIGTKYGIKRFLRKTYIWEGLTIR